MRQFDYLVSASPAATDYRSCLLGCVLLVCVQTSASVAQPPQPAQAPQDNEAASVTVPGGAAGTEAEFEVRRIRGHVRWVAEALAEQFGISTLPAAAENELALLTPDGRLIPIVENLRGNAFRKDERLRAMELELLVREYAKQPYVQILKIYELADGKRFEIDYWCDICAIIMYVKGPCSCCQDDNRLRKRLVEDLDDQPLKSPVD